MTLQELIAYFRSQVADEEQPYLWSDDEAVLYAADAQDELVTRMGGIADATTDDLTLLTLVAGQPYSDLSPHVLRVRSGRLLTARRDVEFISEADMSKVTEHRYGFTQGLSFDDADQGEVRYGVLGVEDDRVRWVRVPAAPDTCRLHVLRLPYPRIADADDALEVDERHHIHLVHWMKHLAYSKQDAETRDDKAAAAAAAQFSQYAELARQRQERKRYKPRVVHYGGL